MPAVGTYRGLWFCQPCFDTMAATNEKPFMTVDDLAAEQDDHPEAHTWEEWRQLEHQPGGSSESRQRPVKIAPIPSYPAFGAPESRREPGAQHGRDPEPVAVIETPVPVSPTPRRIRPFLPARREPEHFPTQQQPTAEIIRHEPVPAIRNPMRNPSPAPTRVIRFPEPEKGPENFGSEFSPEISSEFLPEPSPNFLRPENELTPGAKSEFSGQPKCTTKLYDKQPEPKKRGRQRAKDRHSAADGVRQLFELWWRRGGRGVTFQQFYRHDLSDDMRSYYAREYINGRNPKSAAEYRQWRKEWAARTTVKTA